MAEYIDRQELFKNLNKFALEHYNATINKLIIEQPTADVVEVVRCKDCQWYDNHECQNPYIHMSDAAHMYTYTTDYCSYGLRKPQ